jgi:DNA-binding transcriptional ArsR family regulator
MIERVADRPSLRLRAVHRALADPLRIQLFELVSAQPRSVRELARLTGRQPNRLYHHLAQLEEAKLIEVADYRRLPGGKVERAYAPAAVEPAGDDASPADVALLLNAVLETTRADINAATLAQEAGQDRRIALGRTALRLSQQHLEQLKAGIEALLLDAQDHPDDDVWTTLVWVAVDRQDRRFGPSSPATAQKPRPAGPEDKKKE